MDLEITGRGTQVTAKLRAQAEAGLDRIEKVIGPKCSAKIVLTEEKNRRMAEVTIHSTMHDLSARCEAKEMDIALKDSLDKVELQAVKNKKKIVTTRHHPEQSGAGSVRLQSSDDEIKAQTDPESKRLAGSKTSTGKALGLIDDGELHDEQDIAS